MFFFNFHSEKNAQITNQLQIRLTNLACVARTPPPFFPSKFLSEMSNIFIPQHRCTQSNKFNVLMHCTFIWPLGVTLTLINCVNFLKLTSQIWCASIMYEMHIFMFSKSSSVNLKINYHRWDIFRQTPPFIFIKWTGF